MSVFPLQGPEHPNPGKPFTARGFPRQCYLPDNAQGRKVMFLPPPLGRGPPAGASARWVEWGGPGLALGGLLATLISASTYLTATGGGGLDPGLAEEWATPFWGPCCGLGIFSVPGVQGEVTGLHKGSRGEERPSLLVAYWARL